MDIVLSTKKIGIDFIKIYFFYKNLFAGRILQQKSGKRRGGKIKKTAGLPGDRGFATVPVKIS